VHVRTYTHPGHNAVPIWSGLVPLSAMVAVTVTVTVTVTSTDTRTAPLAQALPLSLGPKLCPTLVVVT
jgi:hypothetical protein